MPDPKSVFTAFKADLEAVGITVNESSKPWNGGYLDGVEAHKADLYLLGWTGDYNTPDNFIGTFFTRTDNRFNTGNTPWGAQLSADLKAADADSGRDPARRGVREDQQADDGEYLPAVPISHSPPAIVVAGQRPGPGAQPAHRREVRDGLQDQLIDPDHDRMLPGGDDGEVPIRRGQRHQSRSEH